jgi:hypothetical protein
MTYETDETAESLAVPGARLRDAAANHAAEANVVYPLQRRGAPGLSDEVVSP